MHIKLPIVYGCKKISSTNNLGHKQMSNHRTSPSSNLITAQCASGPVTNLNKLPFKPQAHIISEY